LRKRKLQLLPPHEDRRQKLELSLTLALRASAQGIFALRWSQEPEFRTQESRVGGSGVGNTPSKPGWSVVLRSGGAAPSHDVIAWKRMNHHPQTRKSPSHPG